MGDQFSVVQMMFYIAKKSIFINSIKNIRNTIFYIFYKIDKNRLFSYIKKSFEPQKIDLHNFLHILAHSKQFFEKLFFYHQKSYKIIKNPSFSCYLISKNSI